ncbi:MAG: competence/damage-inducible protein A [Egibacteraceae bacterium]
MRTPVRVSIVIVGDEILDGYVRDTNSAFLAQRLAALGVPLDRIVTVPDTVAAIGEALLTELRRSRARLVVTSGGIGSTPDDVTMRAVASALGLQLVEHPVIAERLHDLIARARDDGRAYDEEQAQALLRMALTPAGADPLHGAVGAAPGVLLSLDGGLDASGGAAVVILPGVPSELRRITRDGVEPLLSGRGRPRHVTELTHPYPESTLTPLLERLQASFPSLAIGSYPGHECTIRLSGERATVEQAAARVRERLDELAGDASAQRAATAWQQRWT